VLLTKIASKFSAGLGTLAFAFALSCEQKRSALSEWWHKIMIPSII
jgi:hypothetical protein